MSKFEEFLISKGYKKFILKFSLSTKSWVYECVNQPIYPRLFFNISLSSTNPGCVSSIPFFFRNDFAW